MYCFHSCDVSAELLKPCTGQPTISEVLEVVLKECRKESLVYKMAALRCAGDVLHSIQEDRFSNMAEILFPLIKKVSWHHLLSCSRDAYLSLLWLWKAFPGSLSTVFSLSIITYFTHRAAQKVVVHPQGHRMMMIEMRRRKSCRLKLCFVLLRQWENLGPGTHRLKVRSSHQAQLDHHALFRQNEKGISDRTLKKKIMMFDT